MDLMDLFGYLKQQYQHNGENWENALQQFDQAAPGMFPILTSADIIEMARQVRGAFGSGCRGLYVQYKFADAFATLCFQKHHDGQEHDPRYPSKGETIELLRWAATLRDAGSGNDAGHVACVNLLLKLSDVLEFGEPMITHEGKNPATIDEMRVSEAHFLQGGGRGEDRWPRPMEISETQSMGYRSCRSGDSASSRVAQRSASE